MTNQHILFLIILTGAVLRFWDYTSIPFTHDEFSAFFRTGFTDFNELIEKGVKVDTHPPGVQIFMNYWRLIFGDAMWVMKLPFTFMGLAAIYLVWRIGKLWYNETVGLISASFMASLQFTIMYSQIARPYISGLFLTLLMVWYWSKLVKKPDTHFWRNGFLFIISGALCAYNHHFSLLFAALVGFSGLFFLPKTHLAKYVLLGVGIFLLYLPNLPLFLTQLEQGGVGTWLAAPENDFLWQFIRYIFHYSWVLLSVAILILLSSFYFKAESFSTKNFVLFLSWFMLPFLIGFFYSKYENPVLQYSVLLFSFPYLFFILFGRLRTFSPKVNLIISTGIITLSIATLTTNRQHYKLFYNSPYRAVLLNQNEAYLKDENTLRIIESYPKMNHYYNEHLGIDSNYVSAHEFNHELEFLQFLEDNHRQYDQLFYGAYSMANSCHFQMIKQFYPTVENTTHYEGGASYLFSKTVTPMPSDNLLLEEQVKKALANGNSLWANPETFSSEYSGSYSISLDSLKVSKNDLIDIQVQLNTDQTDGEVLLVSDITKDGEVLHWSASNVSQFKPEMNGWFTAYHSVHLAVLNLDVEGAVLKTYVYNKSKKEISLNNYSVSHRKGNPYLYGLYEEIE
ncbi:MAG: glycosyltransferase family 39 protein [Flavobacteriales bacterium]